MASRKQTPEWSIFLLIHTKAADIVHIKNILSDIQRAGVSKRVNLHLCLSTTKRAIRKFDPGICIPLSGDDLILDGYIYHFNGGKRKELPRPEIIPGFDITRKEDIIRFIESSKAKIGKKIMVSTWDHGSVIGVFRQSLPGSERVADPKFGEHYKMLIASDIKYIFKHSFKKKVDILLMMNCDMNFFDFGYTLRKHLRYLVAPVHIISNTGFNYRYIFKKLRREPEVSSRDLAKGIVRKQKRTRPNTDDPSLVRALADLIATNNDDLIFSVNRLSTYKSFAKTIDLLIMRLSELLREGSITRESIQQCSDATKPCGQTAFAVSTGRLFNLVEFESLLVRLKLLSPDKELRTICRTLIAKLDRVTLQTDIGYQVEDCLAFGMKSNAAFSIYFPTVPNPQDIIPEASGFQDFILETSPNATFFSKNHLWDNFLLEVFGK
jgi:hypothetical protein